MLLGHQIARNPETTTTKKKKNQNNQGIIGAGLTFEEQTQTQTQKEAYSNKKELTKKENPERSK